MKGIKTLYDTMLKSLQTRFEKAEKTKCWVLATLLDPWYKGHALALGTLSNAKEWIKEEHATVSEAEKQKRASSEDQGPDPKRVRVMEEDKEEPGPSGLLEQMYANLLGAHGPTSEEIDDEQHISQQLDQYLQEPLIDRQIGQALQWWKQNISRLHLLAPLARKFLSPPPSSVPSERVFSEIGQIYDKKRNKLTGENAERLFPAL